MYVYTPKILYDSHYYLVACWNAAVEKIYICVPFPSYFCCYLCHTRTHAHAHAGIVIGMLFLAIIIGIVIALVVYGIYRGRSEF